MNCDKSDIFFFKEYVFFLKSPSLEQNPKNFRKKLRTIKKFVCQALNRHSMYSFLVDDQELSKLKINLFLKVESSGDSCKVILHLLFTKKKILINYLIL